MRPFKTIRRLLIQKQWRLFILQNPQQNERPGTSKDLAILQGRGGHNRSMGYSKIIPINK